MLNTISKVKNSLETLNNIGKCTNINFSYYGLPEVGGYGIDANKRGYYIKTIDHESLGITKEAFADWFTMAQKELLKQL